MKRDVPWARLFFEGLVIVASILLAFGIDAWWEGVGERRIEDEALAEIRADFRVHLEVLQQQQASYADRLRASEVVLASVGPSATGGDAELIGAIGRVGISVPVRFPAGAVEAAAGNSGLALFRSVELRQALREWLKELEALEGVNEFVMEEGTGYIDYLRSRYPIQDVDRAAGLSEIDPSDFEVDVTVLLRDLSFANWVYQQHYATGVMLARLDELIRIAESVLDAAEAG